ncbi:hypothetical protein BBP40_006512 [Aspergillus hancockii]|nr:hypothetical protein BBP40_006512 [Aspergillus hancockii]
MLELQVDHIALIIVLAGSGRLLRRRMRCRIGFIIFGYAHKAGKEPAIRRAKYKNKDRTLLRNAHGKGGMIGF